MSDKYAGFSADEVALLSEDMIRLLGEVEAGDAAVMLLEGYSYFRMTFTFQVGNQALLRYRGPWGRVRWSDY